MANTMKALRFHGAKDLRLDDVPVPEVKDDQVKVRPAWAGICGTDLHEYLIGPSLCPTTAHPITGDTIPVTLGHEFSGIVEEVGANVTEFKPGDRVVLEPIIFDGTCPACNAGHLNSCASNGFVGLSGYGGGFAEHIVLPATYFQHLPQGVTLKTGALIEPLAVAMRAIRNANIASTSDSILILGAGPIGLAILLCLRAKGYTSIIVSEPSSGRRKLASSMKASHVLDPITEGAGLVEKIKQLTPDSQGVDVMFDCAGVQQAWDTAILTVRARGTVACVAVWERKLSLDVAWLLFKERKMVGCAAPEHCDFLEVFEALRNGKLEPDALITKTVGLDDVEGGFVTLIEDKATHAKVLVEVAGGQ